MSEQAPHKSSTKAAPLWQQLQQVALVVQQVQAGGSTTQALEQVPAGLRPGVQALAYRVLRGLGIGRWLREQLVPRKPAPLLDALLCSALVLAWRARQEAGSEADGYTDFTLVNQAVEAAKRHPRLKHQGALVNAVLRRFLREREALEVDCAAASPEHDPELLNLPRWWWQRLQQDYGAQAAGIVHQALRPAPLTLRVNARHMTARDYLDKHLRPAGMGGILNGAYGVTLHEACPVQQLPGFAQGWVSVQDAAAQLAAPLLLGEAGEAGRQNAAAGAAPAESGSSPHAAAARPLRVLDACAAPGGKTAHLLELGDHAVTALDVDPARCQRIHDSLQRLGLQATVLAADAGDPASWWDGEPFDAILLDAPCTAAGIVRRHPDVPWLRRAQDVPQLAAQQRRLLEALWPLLAPGGRLLYCTCSVFREEGSAQVDAFLQRHADAHARPAPGHLLPTHHSQGDGVGENGTLGAGVDPAPLIDHDGFFYALLAKQS